jgi:DNA-directed RNA polymerase III subunit RPC1
VIGVLLRPNKACNV